MALVIVKCRERTLMSTKLMAYCGLSLLVCLLPACQMPGSVRQGEGSVIAESADRLQFPGVVKALAFSQGGHALMAGGCEAGGDKGMSCTRGLMSVWSLEGSTPESTLSFPKAVTAMAVSPDGAKWIAGDSEGRLILSTNAARGVSSRVFHQKGEITTLAFSPDGRWVASGSLDASFPLGLMEIKTGGVIKVKVPFEPVSAVAFARDGKHLGVGMQDGSVVIWNFTSREPPLPITNGRGAKRPVSSLVFSPDDRLLAYGRQDGRVVIIDRTSEQVLSEILLSSAVTALAFSPDGLFLAVSQDNGKATLIESAGWQEKWSKRHIVSVTGLAFSPDGRSLAVAVQRGVFIYQLGYADSTPGSLPPADRMTKTGYQSQVTPDLRQVRSSGVSSRKFASVLQISQDEFFWLLPFDRLVGSSVEAMQRAVPGAVIERVGLVMSGKLRVVVGRRSLSLDLNRLRKSEGRTGLREAVQAYESVQRVLLEARPGAATILEDAAVSAVLAELGPGVRLVPQSEMGLLVQERRDAAKGAPEKDATSSAQFAEEAMMGDGVRYLKLTRFSRSVAKQVQRWSIGGVGTQGQPIAHILDLRDNTGADLDSVIETADSLLPKGQVIAELIARKTGERTQYRSKGSGQALRVLVVLVNERTAGTAELLACAIQESGAGVLVGGSTSGVDDVYSLFPLPGGDGLRVSTGRFFCPSERSVRWKGQSVDMEAGRVSSVSGIPVGVSQADSFSRSRLASPLSAGLPMMADHQLRVGVEVAMCIRRMQLEAHVATSPTYGVELSGSLPGVCRMISH